MTKKFAVAAAVALLTLTGPAHAATIQWNLDNMAEVGNPGVKFTGFFDYDTVTQNSPFWNISMSGSDGSFNFVPPNSFAAFANGAFGPQFGFGTNGINGNPVQGVPGVLQVIVILAGLGLPFDGSVSTIPLYSPASFLAEIHGGNVGHTTGESAGQLSGSLTEVSAVPLPAALPCSAVG